MLVDSTLFVQIVNFLGAYLILTRIFLKPAYRMIIEQRIEHDQLVRDTELQEASTHEYKQRLYAQLVQTQHMLVNTLPALELDNQPPIAGYPVEQCDHARVALNHEELSTLLVDQVIHDAVK